MKKRNNLISVFVILIALILYITLALSFQQKNGANSEANLSLTVHASIDSLIPYQKFTIEASINYKNLQIFPITGNYGITDKKYVTLTEGLDNEYVIVNETSEVNELSMTNNSDHYIFIHSGDIVKGGKQDRTIQYDVIVPPREKDLPLASFCVERGRWSARENEAVGSFGYSSHNVSSRDLKVSAKKLKSQAEVWDKVDKQKNKLAVNMSIEYDTVFMFNNVSNTSLQLALEDSTLIELRATYKTSYSSFLNRTDVIGMAYAINGEVYGIDIFNNDVFLRLKEKMIDGFITEAVGDLDSSSSPIVATTADVKSLLFRPDQTPDQAESNDVNSETKFDMMVYGTINRFVTTDKAIGEWLHLNILRESEETKIEQENAEEIFFNNGR